MPKQILNEKYRKTKQIGEGRFSIVYSGVFLSNSNMIAIKESKPGRRNKEKLKKEAKILSAVYGSTDKHVIRMFDHFEENDRYYIILEHCQGNLLDWMDMQDNDPTFEQSVDILNQLATALEWIHSKGVIHTDLKPENVMYNESLTGQINIRLTDFGNACFKGNTSPWIQTRNYRAPEVILYAPYDESSDIWSYGCMAYEILTMGELLFDPRASKAPNFPLYPRDMHHLNIMHYRLGPLPKRLISRGVYSELYYDFPSCNLAYTTSPSRSLERKVEDFTDDEQPRGKIILFLKFVLQYLPEERPTATECKELLSILLTDE